MTADRGPEVAGVVGLFLALSWLFVSLRLYVKAFLTKSWGADDLLLGISLIFFSTYSACALLGVKYGTGRHLPDIPLDDVPKALYYWWLCELFYTITTVFIRLSIAVFLLRICTRPAYKYTIHGTLAMVLAFSIFYFFLVIFQCSPVTFFWAQYMNMKGSCIDPAVVPDASIAHSAVSFTADWILGLLPIAILWHIQMNTRTKGSIAAILAMGLLAGVATMIRVPYIKVLALTDDFLYATTDVAIWSTVEPGLGIVATGAATLRPLFRSFYSLSSRGTHQKSNPHTSRWRNSPAGYLRNHNNNTNHAYKNSQASSQISGAIQLRSNISAPGVVVTSVRSLFGDSRDGERGDSMYEGGIKVHKTVVISRAEDSDEDSEHDKQWPMENNRRDQDFV